MIQWLTVLTLASYAYVPPPGFILKTLAQKHAGFTGVSVQGVLKGPEGTSLRVVTVYSFKEEKGVTEFSDESGKKLALNPINLNRGSILSTLLFSHEPKLSLLNAKAFGVPTAEFESVSPDLGEIRKESRDDAKARDREESRTVARIGRRVAWVLGKKGEPQIFIEKDSFFPLKVTTGAGSNPSEVLMETYRSSHEYTFPNQVKWVQGRGETVGAQFDTTDLRAFPDKGVQSKPLPFPGLTARVPSELTFTEEGKNSNSATQELIKRHAEWFW